MSRSKTFQNLSFVAKIKAILPQLEETFPVGRMWEVTHGVVIIASAEPQVRYLAFYDDAMWFLEPYQANEVCGNKSLISSRLDPKPKSEVEFAMILSHILVLNWDLKPVDLKTQHKHEPV